MPTLAESLGDWFGNQRDKRLGDVVVRREATGAVLEVGEGIATVAGLPGVGLDELLLIDGEASAIALRLDEDRAGCALLSNAAAAAAGAPVRGTGEVVRVGVGEAVLGRVIDHLGQPLDGGPPIAAERRDPIERPAPGIIERDLVTEPLQTGVTVVDAMIPLGRGQRELIIGDRKTGKTALAVDAIINQRDSDVVCVYAAIGQKASSVAQVVDAVRAHGALERCVFVVGQADSAPGAQWLTPYAACTIAEYFRDRGRHALLVLDDLTKHAAIYRELSLLLRSPPGREAYPGDIFYTHSRLLERAAKLSHARGGGSLTALAIAETQAGNLTAYIPTNLVSITDGQIYLEPQLFYAGQRPAVNVGKSVSRVGGKTQSHALRQVSESLRLEYAQFVELELFTRFGAVADERSRKVVEHGRRIRAVLAQPRYQPLRLEQEVALLVALGGGILDGLPLERVGAFREAYLAAAQARCGAALTAIGAGTLGEPERAALLEVARAEAALLTGGG